ncbi:MAG: heavy-metal-associated domain-containing protein [Bacteroidales bacterium]|nr:heavy-metal-associated domain-containing protein [Bacteroidales bacterium]
MILITLLSVLLILSPAVVNAYPETVPSSVQDKKVKKTETVTFKVSMHCKSCVAKITDNISFVKGVKDLKVSLDQKTVSITYSPAKTDEATLQKAIEKLGYCAEKVQEPNS